MSKEEGEKESGPDARLGFFKRRLQLTFPKMKSAKFNKAFNNLS